MTKESVTTEWRDWLMPYDHNHPELSPYNHDKVEIQRVGKYSDGSTEIVEPKKLHHEFNVADLNWRPV